MAQALNSISEVNKDDYIARLHKFKLSKILLRQMLQHKVISDNEYLKALVDFTKLYRIKD